MSGTRAMTDGRRPRRFLLPLILVLVAVLIAAAAVVILKPWSPDSPLSLSSPPPESSPGSTGSALDADLPRTAAVRGTIDDWTAADDTQVAAVLPEVGSAADGTVSVVVDAPSVTSRTTVLSAKATVEPGEKYEFHASLRQLTPKAGDVPAELVIGGKTIKLPALGPGWTELTDSYTAASGEKSVEIALVVTDGVSGLGVDDLSLTASDGKNVLPNPSFEKVEVAAGIANDTLVTTVGTATLAVAGPTGKVSWKATGVDGTEAATGSAEVSGAVGAVPLDGLGQGYFNVELTDGAGAKLAASVVLIDIPQARVPLDKRLGAVLHLENDYNRDAARASAALGFGSARNDVLWDRNEKKAGEISFDKVYTEQFARLSANGVGLLAMIGYGNPLYDDGVTPSSAEGIAAYANYAKAIAEEFKPEAVEVYNEFNHPPFNQGACGLEAKCYLPLLQAVHEAVGEADPDVKVVAGATAYYEDEWFDALWTLGGLEYADAVSFHPYDVRVLPERLVERVQSATETMERETGKSLPAWVTELGWTTRTGGIGVKPEEQGSWLIRGETTALAAGLGKFFWYDLIDDGTDPNDDLTNYGLYHHPVAGVAALVPKPGAFAQALLTSKIAGLEYTSSDKVGGGARSVVLGEGDDLLRIAWRIPEDPAVTVSYPAKGTVTVTDALGTVSTLEPQDGKVTIELTATPVFLEGTSKGKASVVKA